MRYKENNYKETIERLMKEGNVVNYIEENLIELARLCPIVTNKIHSNVIISLFFPLLSDL